MRSRSKSFRKGWEIFRPFRKQFTVVISLLVLMEMLTLSAPYLFGKVLNAIQAGAPMNEVLVLGTFTLLLSLITIQIGYKKDVYELKNVDFSVNSHLTQKTLSKILGLSIGQHRSQNSGITQSVVSQGQGSLEQMMFLLLFTVLPMVLNTLITAFVLLWFNFLVGSVVSFGIGLYIFLSVSDNRKYWPQVKQLININHRTRKSYTEILRNLSLVQTNSQEKKVIDEHKTRVDKWSDHGKGLWIPFSTIALRRHALTAFLRYVVLVIGVFLVYKRGYKFGDFVILISWTAQATSQLGVMGRMQRQWMDLWGQVKKYFAILEVEPTVRVEQNPIRPERFAGEVEFRSVSFTYPNLRYVEADEDDDLEKYSEASGAKDPALIDVSFKISAGERVAFVGESGAGKSTIVNLLMRGYDPNHGQILIDGHDLRLLDLTHFRESVGLVEQNVSLLDNTLRYNLLFGRSASGNGISEDDLARIARESCIDRFEHRLTNGWETLIGENGIQLSGGERQRVGIGRALVKDPRFLILDEATSSLDAVNESLIREAVQAASVGRTTIIIAHRLSTVRDVDRIFVMSRGSIVGEGRHDDLYESSLVYRELVVKQLFKV